MAKKKMTPEQREQSRKETLERYRKNRAESVKNSKYFHRYGLTSAEAEAIYARGCEACGSTYRVNIDHDHETGKVRGCLCNNCNRALGLLGDSPDRVSRLLAYIALHKPKPS